MSFLIVAVVLFVLIPALATRLGVDSRPGFSNRPDWRPRNS
jgi:hypothetical protein